LTLALLFLINSSIAQPLPNRYVSEVFDDVEKTSQVLFSENAPQPVPGGGFYEFITGLPLNVDEFETDPVDLYLDLYEPIGDTLSNRPAVVICFGGGFLDGSKDHWSIVLLAEALARSGFVTATIDYRLGMNVFDSDLATRAVYRGLQDGRAAVKYLRTNAESLGIVTDQIFIGGHSSGAFIALHNLYLDLESERPISTFEWIQEGQDCPDLGCLDCTGLDNEVSGQANAAFNLAGAVGFLSFIEDSLDGRTVSFHSQDDGTVPYESGEPFSDVSPLLVGSDLPVVYGSHPVSLRSDTVDLIDSLYSYTNRGHGVHENGETSLYSDIVPGIGSWFYEQRLKPSDVIIAGLTDLCVGELNEDYVYSINSPDGEYFDWQISGGTFTYNDPLDTFVIVTWSDTASDRSLSVTPYNQYQASGSTALLNIEVSPINVNNWIGGSGSWSDPLNWNLGHVPNRCENIMIQHLGPQITIDIEVGNILEVKSATIIGDVSINLEAGALINIRM